jgi:phosphatidate cytidylyltransferase
MSQVTELTGLQPNVAWALAGVLAVLATGSIARILWIWRVHPSRQERRSRLGSLITWWCLYALVAAVAVLGIGAGVAVFAVLSLLGLGEYRKLAQRRIVGAAPWRWVYAAVPIHYLLVYAGWLGPLWTFIPVWVLLALLVRLAVAGRTKDFLETTGTLFLGLMLNVFLLSHAPLLLTLPDDLNLAAGTQGLFVYLVVLTEWNDIAQALVGRRFGKRRLAPRVSPGKTWEGFLGGVLTTVVIAVLVAPLLTPFGKTPPALEGIGVPLRHGVAAAAGALIAVGGFFGDITMSAIKREVKVKDSGRLLPGQGGMLDRIDSLTFTAPLIFYFTLALYSE